MDCSAILVAMEWLNQFDTCTSCVKIEIFGELFNELNYSIQKLTLAQQFRK
jgi:hypothetical protein